jgi:uncharacterized membrane protein YqjE
MRLFFGIVADSMQIWASITGAARQSGRCANVAMRHERDLLRQHEKWRAPMADPAVKRPADGARDQSLGSLVSLAVSDVSQLLKYELDLAKLELKADVRRLGIAGALMGMAAFVGCLVLVLLCFAFAYGLITLGIWSWAAFLIVAGTCVVLAGVGVLIGALKVRKLSGLRKTRRTVQDDLGLLRRNESDAAKPVAGASSPAG